MNTNEVVLVPHKPEWNNEYNREKKQIIKCFTGEDVIIEHIGSTAVHNIIAKPVIDIMLGTENLSIIERHIPQLGEIGYTYLPEYEEQIPERRFFHKIINGITLFHLHGVEKFGEFWVDKLLFRDYLRKYPETAKEYEELKKNLASKYKFQRSKYTESKTSFIRDVVKKAKKEFNR